MQKITPYEITKNPFTLIGKQWAMITTCQDGKVNTMTASWGGVGIMWGKPAAFLFIRPQRFTRELMDKSGKFSVCFLPESQREAMAYCGKASGRNENKLAACGLTAGKLAGVPVLDQSELALICRKLYRQRLDPACLVEKEIDATWYPNQDHHYMYIAEIETAYTK